MLLGIGLSTLALLLCLLNHPATGACDCLLEGGAAITLLQSPSPAALARDQQQLLLLSNNLSFIAGLRSDRRH